MKVVIFAPLLMRFCDPFEPRGDAYFVDHRRELIEEAKAIVSQRKPRTAEAA